MSDDAYALNELDRRVANIVRIGTVTEIDVDAAKVKVDLADEDGDPHITEWIPWSTRRGGEDKVWDPPDVDEQVIVFAPGGELEQAFVWGALFSDDNPPNGDDENVRRITFKDGSIFEIDREESIVNMTLNNDAVFTIKIGPMEIKVTKDLVEVGAGAQQFVALAQDTLDRLTAIVNSFNSHQVQAGALACPIGPVSGVSGTPVAPMSTPNSVASTKLKAE